MLFKVLKVFKSNSFRDSLNTKSEYNLAQSKIQLY